MATRNKGYCKYTGIGPYSDRNLDYIPLILVQKEVEGVNYSFSDMSAILDFQNGCLKFSNSSRIEFVTYIAMHHCHYNTYCVQRDIYVLNINSDNFSAILD